MLDDVTDFGYLENTSLAQRLKHELVLFRAIEKEWKGTFANRKTYPKGYERFKTKILMRNLKKGVKQIEKKNPLYIEMPKLESVGNGQVKKVYDTNYMDSPTDEEIEVYGTIAEPQDGVGLIEE